MAIDYTMIGKRLKESRMAAKLTQEKVAEAAKKARCYDFIMALPQDFDTIIGEGGMTLSGGEILAQPAAAAALLRQARREGIHTAIETSFYAPVTAVEEVLPYVQDAFVDLKLYDREKHLAYCGAENGSILYNLLHTNEMDWRGRLILRVPVIPGVNDDPQELEQIAWFCTKLTRLDHIQLLPYHRLGVDTYRKLGRAYLLADTLVPTAEHMEACRTVIRKYYPHVI